MRFYREKCLAALMEQLGDWMSSIQIQKTRVPLDR